MFRIRMGVPEMEEFWTALCARVKGGSASKTETTLYNKIGTTLAHLAENPRHPGLQTHEIDILSKRYGVKVWQSYIENRTSAARRLYWVYGPGKDDITVIGLEPHPNDKKNAYRKIVLSGLPVEQ
ncbi:MAG: hypothetical protein J5785_06035 [Spirochaetales bacterium]|nr:hypothetical protein [Spirochaetales bacterium]